MHITHLCTTFMFLFLIRSFMDWGISNKSWASMLEHSHVWPTTLGEVAIYFLSMFDCPKGQ